MALTSFEWRQYWRMCLTLFDICPGASPGQGIDFDEFVDYLFGVYSKDSSGQSAFNMVQYAATTASMFPAPYSYKKKTY